jgi:hypothetical protein
MIITAPLTLPLTAASIACLVIYLPLSDHKEKQIIRDTIIIIIIRVLLQRLSSHYLCVSSRLY